MSGASSSVSIGARRTNFPSVGIFRYRIAVGDFPSPSSLTSLARKSLFSKDPSTSPPSVIPIGVDCVLSINLRID